MAERLYNLHAIVLKRMPLGEADRIVRLFSREHGKVSAVAKGARRLTSKTGGATEPMTRLHAQLAAGRTLEVLTQAQVEASRTAVRRDLERLACGSFFLELIDAAIEERQPLPELYDLLDAALTALETAAEPLALTHAFTLQALAQLGFEPDLHECVLDAVALESRASRFLVERGGLLCPACTEEIGGGLVVSAATVRALRGLSRLPMAEAATTRLLPGTRPELARVLAAFARYSLEAPLRSLEFLQEVTAERP